MACYRDSFTFSSLVLCNILKEFGISLEITLIKMCLTKVHCKAHTGKYLSDEFPIHRGLKHEDVLSPLFLYLQNMSLGRWERNYE
jgi:hypothetical protein